jgi:hypothetical protein
MDRKIPIYVFIKSMKIIIQFLFVFLKFTVSLSLSKVVFGSVAAGEF